MFPTEQLRFVEEPYEETMDKLKTLSSYFYTCFKQSGQMLDNRALL